MAADLELYDSLGFQEIVSFGCYLGADYRALYGDPPIQRYGDLLYGVVKE